MNKKLFSKRAAVLMLLAILLPTKGFHCFIPGWVFFGWLVAFVLSFKFGKGQRFSILLFLPVDLCCTLH